MLCDLIIDGNFVLNRLVFTLHKNNLLFGALHTSLENAITTYKRWYPFANVYLVSDSKEKSWRKKLNPNYKAHRKKDTDIDWDFVFTCYNEFKDSIRGKGIKILEAPQVEGDDWISFLVERGNSEDRSTIIVSNDYDIKQLLKFSLDPLFINIMSNEFYNKQKLFLPENYQLFLNSFSKIDNNDIFNLNDNQDFYNLVTSFIEKYEIQEVNPVESLIIKIVAGDTSDNISSAFSIIKNGKKRGIAEKGAKNLFDEYIINFGEPELNDPDLLENIADLICEKKKVSKSNILNIQKNLDKNLKLIYLKMDNLPEEIFTKMDTLYQESKNFIKV